MIHFIYWRLGGRNFIRWCWRPPIVPPLHDHELDGRGDK